MSEIRLAEVGDVIEVNTEWDAHLTKWVGADFPKIGSRFVVEKTEMSGGGTGHGPHDVFPDGHKVTARMLTRDGSYSPSMPTVGFYQTGCFTAEAMIQKLKFIDKMQMMFVKMPKKK